MMNENTNEVEVVANEVQNPELLRIMMEEEENERGPAEGRRKVRCEVFKNPKFVHIVLYEMSRDYKSNEEFAKKVQDRAPEYLTPDQIRESQFPSAKTINNLRVRAYNPLLTLNSRLAALAARKNKSGGTTEEDKGDVGNDEVLLLREFADAINQDVSKLNFTIVKQAAHDVAQRRLAQDKKKTARTYDEDSEFANDCVSIRAGNGTVNKANIQANRDRVFQETARFSSTSSSSSMSLASSSSPSVTPFKLVAATPAATAKRYRPLDHHAAMRSTIFSSSSSSVPPFSSQRFKSRPNLPSAISIARRENLEPTSSNKGALDERFTALERRLRTQIKNEFEDLKDFLVDLLQPRRSSIDEYEAEKVEQTFEDYGVDDDGSNESENEVLNVNLRGKGDTPGEREED